MKLILFLLFLMNAVTHDIQVAYYKIHQEDQEIIVDFVFEKEDVFQVLEEKDLDLLNDALPAYLAESFSVKINQEKLNFNFSKVEIKNRHVHLSGSLTKRIEIIKSIEIDNECLLDIIGHSNIVQLRLHNEERDFLMNADRTNIKIGY